MFSVLLRKIIGKELYANKIIKTSILVILLLVVGLNITVSYLQMRQAALNEANEKANLLIQHNLAIHTYYAHQLKPTIFDDLAGMRDEESFSPEWMSSTYAVREIDNYFRQLSLFDDYYYKEAAINARYPINEADPLERDFLQRLNADPTLQEDVRIRIIYDQPYFVTMIRGESMTAECLVCHTTPENAPAELVSVYGGERSFNRHDGEVVSAISIRIPLATAFQKANQNFTNLALILFLLLILLYLAFTWFINKYMLNPIREIRSTALQIAKNESLLGQEILLPRVEELRGLTSAFNQLSVNLRKHEDGLEETIQERTQSLSQNQRFLDEILTALPNMVFLVDIRTGKILYKNRAMSVFFEELVEESLTADLSLFEEKIHSDHKQDYQNLINELSKKKDAEVIKRYLQIGNSENNWIWLELRALVFEWGEKGSPEQILFITRDVTAQKQAEEKLIYLGLHDALTGVKNRNAFDSALQEMIEVKYYPMTIMMGDVDNLKEQNDRFGHEAGDRLLQLMADTMRSCLRSSDLIARIGGDEFVLLLPNTNESAAQEIKSRILDKLSLVLNNGSWVNSGLSLGMVTIDMPDELTGVMSIVDHRMYDEKAKKHNHYRG